MFFIVDKARNFIRGPGTCTLPRFTGIVTPVEGNKWTDDIQDGKIIQFKFEVIVSKLGADTDLHPYQLITDLNQWSEIREVIDSTTQPLPHYCGNIPMTISSMYIRKQGISLDVVDQAVLKALIARELGKINA